ncbi:serine/threonine-protein kinase [Rhodococcus sp. NPDC047139]|uniref:serine/threonine-protein kinase n=1 Tax=Rhodococcus sp. NPDC047139 TaxID=3155141 RepID=UPI0033CDA304
MTVHNHLGGRYELSGLLGVGATGEIYAGWDTRLHRPVAVKLLRREIGRRPDARRRFDLEARAAAVLSHPHIVTVYDTGEYDGRPYIVMERLPGRTLAHDIACGSIPVARVRTVLVAVLEALVAAHESGILHRDIKPANLLVSENGHIKVADFGIAKMGGDDLTGTGELVGTVAYLSPGRITGHPASVSDDLYALGVVGYEALCGRRPFSGDNILALARAITHEQPPPLSDLCPHAPPGLLAVIERAMARDPSDRFGSAREMLAALHAADDPGAATTRLSVSGVVTAPLSTAVPARDRADRLHRALLATGTTLVGAIVVGGLVLGLGRDTASAPAVVPETRTPGTYASLPERVTVTTDASPSPEAVPVPASAPAEIPAIPPVVARPESTEPDSRGNSGNGNAGSNNGNGNGNRNGNSTNGNGNNGNGNSNRGNGNGS